MTDVFTVERVIEPIQAWQYDGTGNAWPGEDRSTWPVWLQRSRTLGFLNGGALVFFKASGRETVHKGDLFVLDAGEIFHFDSRKDFERRYQTVTRPDRGGTT